jgi:hypothetical protein
MQDKRFIAEHRGGLTLAFISSVGHAVATAYMADHSPGVALYALKAMKLTGKSIEEIRNRFEGRLFHIMTDHFISK